MPCHPMIGPDGKGNGFICSRGRREKPKCFFCGKPSTSLCDFPTKALKDFRRDVSTSKTCDRPLCNTCRVKIGIDTDICPDHDKQEAIDLIFNGGGNQNG